MITTFLDHAATPTRTTPGFNLQTIRRTRSRARPAYENAAGPITTDVASGESPGRGPCSAHADPRGRHRNPGAGQVTFDAVGNPSVSSHDPPGFGCLLVPHLSRVTRYANLTSPSGSLHSYRSSDEVMCYCVGPFCVASLKGRRSIEEPVEVSRRRKEIMRGRPDQDVT